MSNQRPTRSDVSTATLPWSTECIGLDVQATPPAAVHAERRRGRVRFTTLDVDTLAETAAGASAVPVATGLAPGESIARWVKAPFGSLPKARRILPTLLDVELPFAVEDCVYDFLAVHRDSDGKAVHALAVGARIKQVEAALAQLEAQGITPTTLDLRGLAIWTQSRRECPPAQGGTDARAVIALDGDGCTVVVGVGDRFMGAHALPGATAPSIRRILKTRFPEEVKEVSWFWTGRGATDAMRVNTLMAGLADEWPGPSTTHAEPETFVARALATRALVPGPLRCDLRKGRLAHPGAAARAGGHASRATALVFAAALLLLAGSGAGLGLARRAERRSVEAFARRRDALLGYSLNVKGARAVEAVRTEVERQQAALTAFDRAFAPSLVPVLEGIMTRADNDGLTYDAISVARTRIHIGGTAARWDAWTPLLDFVREQGYRAQVEPRQILVDDRIPFTVTTGGGNGD